ncbi:hypothetical protein [Alcanivorax sp.]|uniref:hypothetical protein n=1 Tax=Alcanivorax sp. TaxID=1872427 RepID=UPI003A90547B
MNSFWRKHYEWMNEDQWACFEMLCELFHGPHHVYGIVRECGPHGIEINAQNCSNHFGTFDYNNLTRAVVLAHDRMIRFSIEPSAPGMLKLAFHKRHCREGRMNERHPTLEEAIKSIRPTTGDDKDE